MIVQRSQNLKTRNDTKNTIISASSGLRIQMRAHHDWRQIIISAWPNRKQIPHLINRSL